MCHDEHYAPAPINPDEREYASSVLELSDPEYAVWLDALRAGQPERTHEDEVANYP
jgi:hypothetical protein